MVAAVRRGQSLRAVARQFGVGVATVAHWVEHTKGSAWIAWIGRIARPCRTRPGDGRLLGGSGVEGPTRAGPRRSGSRRRGRHPSNAAGSGLGRGALGADHQPHPRASGRLDRRPRTRRPAPPRGWYLPAVAAAKAELDSINIVEGLVIKDGPQVEVLNVVSLHGGLVGSWPVEAPVTSARTLAALVEALAGSRLARLRPVRQRHDLPGHAPLC